MLTKVVFSVIRDEEFYVGMAIQSVIDYVEGIYILDTGSKDGTLEVIEDFQKRYPGKIILEQKDFGGSRRFDNTPSNFYREMDARNYCLERAEEIFKTVDWFIQLDVDEVYNKRYWDCFEEIEKYPIAISFGHSTNMLSSPYTVMDVDASCSIWGNAVTGKRERLFDPHVLAWNRNKLSVGWIHSPGRHVCKVLKGTKSVLKPTFITGDHVHLHLHRSFGPKSLSGWFTLGLGWEDAAKTLNIPLEEINNQKIYEEKFPRNFIDGKFIPPDGIKEIRDKYSIRSINLTHPLPPYVVEKWIEWGGWVV
jgi:glycosyltransferase involved in cell wall biosynthesis